MSDIRTMIDDSIIEMMFHFPVYAHLITRIGYKVVNDESLPYCGWTDGKTIFINEYGIKTTNENYPKTPMDKKQIIFLLSHELGHILGLTWDRGKALGIDCKDTTPMGQMKNELWNIATDYEINSLLYNNKSGHQSKPIGRKPEWVLYDEKYINKTAEEIYKELLEQSKDDMEQMQQLIDELMGDGDIESDGDGNSNSKGKSKGGKGEKIQLDKHIDVELTEMEKSDLRAKVESAFSSSGYSSDSSALERFKNFVLQPVKFNWRQALRKYMKSLMKSDYTWQKPARSGIYRGLILPSPDKRATLRVGVAIDTSGSISDKELNCFMNHLLVLAKQFKHYQVDVWCFSTAVHENTLVTFTEKSKNIIDKIKLDSFGGTDISCNFDWVKKHYGSEKPDVLIVFSDFQDRLDNDTTTRFDYCKCIWLVLNNKKFIQPKLIKAERFDYELD